MDTQIPTIPLKQVVKDPQSSVSSVTPTRVGIQQENPANVALVVIVILFVLFEIGRVAISVNLLNHVKQLYYQYIVRSNFVVVTPKNVTVDRVVVDLVNLSKPGYIVIRTVPKPCSVIDQIVAYSQYLYAGEFYNVSLPFGDTSATDEASVSAVVSGTKLRIQLYADDGDGILNLSQDPHMLDSFNKPIMTEVTVL